MGILVVRVRPVVRGVNPAQQVGEALTVPLGMADRKVVLVKGRHVVRGHLALRWVQTAPLGRVKRDVQMQGPPGVVLPASRLSPMVKLARGRRVRRVEHEIQVAPALVRGLLRVVRQARHVVAGPASLAVDVPKGMGTVRASPVQPHEVTTGSPKERQHTSRVWVLQSLRAVTARTPPRGLHTCILA